MSDTYQPIYDAVRSRIGSCDVNSAIESVMRDAFSGVQHQALCVGQEFTSAAYEQQRPSVLFRPALLLDGNQWCALYGANLQDGVAGFGATPDEAMRNFDIVWSR